MPLEIVYFLHIRTVWTIKLFISFDVSCPGLLSHAWYGNLVLLQCQLYIKLIKSQLLVRLYTAFVKIL
jgi:hypothetical protein